MGFHDECAFHGDNGVMTYVNCDTDNRTTCLSEHPKGETDELLPLDDPEVKGFPETASSQISSSDTETTRVIEDLVDGLIQKNYCCVPIYPGPPGRKSCNDKNILSEPGVPGNLMVGEEDIRWQLWAVIVIPVFQSGIPVFHQYSMS